MKRKCYLLFVALGLLMVMFASARRSEAALGESADSVELDRKVLSATHGATKVLSGYTVHEVKSDTTDVREYVSPSGIVFGVAWNGFTRPDITQLLGTYAGEYQQALRQTERKRGQRALTVKTDRVVVEQWGHLRNLQGRAYAPALIPDGVSVDDIK